MSTSWQAVSTLHGMQGSSIRLAWPLQCISGKVLATSKPASMTPRCHAAIMLLQGHSVKYLTPDAIIDYIHSNGLYRDVHHQDGLQQAQPVGAASGMLSS